MYYCKANINDEFIVLLYSCILAWKPSVAKGSQILAIFPVKSEHTQLLEYHNHAKNIPVGLQSFRQIGPWVPEF